MSPVFKLQAIVEAVDKLTGPAKRMVGGLKDIEKMAKRGDCMIKYGQRMALTGALVNEAGRRMVGSIQSIMEPTLAVEAASKPLESSLDATNTTLGSISKSMNAARRAALDWSRAHADSAQSFLSMSYQMVSAGLNDVQGIEASRQALAVAKATLASDIPKTGEMIATLFNNMSDSSKPFKSELRRIADIVTKTQQYFQFSSVDVLAESYKYATPAALQFRMSLEETSAVIGQLNNAGLQGGMAGTSFAASMRQMTKASKMLGFEMARTSDGDVSFIGTLANIKKRYGDLSRLTDAQRMKFQEAFGDEGLRAVILLSSKLEEMDRGLKAVKNSTGATARAQKQIESSAAEQMKITQNRLDALKVQAGNSLLPTLNSVLPVVTRIIDRLGRFADAHPNLAKTALLMTAIGGGALAVVGPVLSVGGSFISVAGHGVKAFAKLGKGYQKVQGWLKDGNLEKWAQNAGKAIDTAKRLGTAVLNFGKQAILTAVRAMPGLIASVWSFTASLLANPITWIVLGVAALTVGIVLLAKNWRKVTGWLRAGWAWAVDGFRKVLDWFRNSKLGKIVASLLLVFMPFVGIPLLIAMNWKKIATVARTVWTAVTGFFRKGIDWIKALPWKTILPIIMAPILPFIGIPYLIIKNWDKIWEFLTGLFKRIRELFLGIVNDALSWGRNLLGGFINGINEKIKQLTAALKGAADKIKRFLGFHSPTPEGPGRSADKWAPALMTMYANGINRGARRVQAAALSAALGVSGALAMGAPAVAATGVAAPPSGVSLVVPAPPAGGQGKQIVININGSIALPGVQSAEDFITGLLRLAEEVGE